ncbi:MAG: tetratricopeptide repeat protein, partial [Nanoarchaeota archaeon]|nr:tetratricopeptide repeat protein [Nanoarchaeota archaeon]
MSWQIISLLFITPLALDGLLFQVDKDVKRKFRISFDSAEVFIKKGEYQDALGKLHEALDLAEEHNYEEGRILCYMRLGLLYWNTGELEESTKLYNNALSLAEIHDKKQYANECRISLDIYKHYSEGKEYRLADSYEKSIESFKKAILLAKQIGSIAHEVKCLRLLSISYWSTSNFPNFFRLNQHALKLAIRLNNKREVFRCLNNIGIYHRKAGNYSKALSCYDEAFIVAEKMGSKEEKSVILNNIGNIYKDIGNYDRSLDYLIRSLKIDEELGIKTNIAIDLVNIGETYRARGHFRMSEEDYKNALINFNKCLTLIEEKRNLDKDLNQKNIVKVRSLNNIGTVHLHLMNYNTALEFFKRGYEKAFEILDLEALGMISCNIGEAYFNKGEFERATKQFNMAINIAKKTKAPNILWEAYFGLGKCYEKSNDLQKAVENYENSINEIDNIRSRIVIDTFKTGFVRDKFHVYESLLNLLVRSDEESLDIKEKVFNIIEKAKARAFLESIGESQFKIKEKLSSSLRQREIEITDKISSIIHQLSNPHITETQRNTIQEEYHEAENEYMLLISKMRTEIPEVANMIMPEPCHLGQVQNQLLDEKTAVIEFFLGEKQSYLFAIERNCSYIYLLPSRSEIKKSIRGFIKELSDPPQGVYRGFLAGKRLFKELLLPIEEILPESIEHLIVVPDGLLYFLPFEALLKCSDDQSSESSYLIEKYRISYAPSCSSLLFLRERESRKRHKKSLLAIGNPSYDLKDNDLSQGKSPSQILKEIYKNQGFDFSPLPYSKKEIKEIAKLFPKPLRDVHLGANAQEEVIKTASLEDYQIIHFACHSLLDERFPFRSA